MPILLTLLYGLVIPYLGLMLLVILGMVRRDRPFTSAAQPSVSVVLPAHDEEERLDSTLHSLSSQHYGGDVEFVLVDDRSSDRTGEIMKRHAALDARFRIIRLTETSSRLSPKVNAVNEGITASRGEIIVTTDADCEFPAGWLGTLVSHFAPDVVMVVGYVESTRANAPKSPVALFESVDWFSLMLVARSLTRFGWKFASSANNQAYRRAAFEAAGGFGAIGRAPSGDEDLLTQRLGRLPGARIVFASEPRARVLTRPMNTLPELLRQRKRWVSRYHHFIHYHPGFIASIAVLGFQSVFLSLAILLSLFDPVLARWVAPLWGVKLGIELAGMRIGTEQLDRPDLWGIPALVWALLHPFFIATVVVWSFLQPGDWRGGAGSYRKAFLKRRLREAGRRLRLTLTAVTGAFGGRANG